MADAPAAARSDDQYVPVERVTGRSLEMLIARQTTAAGLGQVDDEEVMYLVGAGDSRAFEVIFDRYSSAAFSLAYRICGKRGLAEDVVQEAFVSLWRNASRYDPGRGSVRSLILSIVHNRAIDAVRRTGPRERHDVSDEGLAERIPATELTETAVEQADEAERIRHALAELPLEQRQVIELAYFDGLTHSQIARELQVPAGTVKGRMRLGLARLRHAPALVAPAA